MEKLQCYFHWLACKGCCGKREIKPQGIGLFSKDALNITPQNLQKGDFSISKTSNIPKPPLFVRLLMYINITVEHLELKAI